MTRLMLLSYRTFVITCCLSFFFLSQLRSQDLVINEFQALNINILADNFGEYDDWIEIFNSSSQPVDLDRYCLTDDLGAADKCVLRAKGSELIIQPGQYLILWADGDTGQGSNHLSFKLSGTGEEIGLFSPEFQMIDFVIYPAQKNNVSMGRNVYDFSEWTFFPVPTPGNANTTQSVAGYSEKPALSEASGVKQAAFQLSMNPAVAGDNVFYSLNARSPDKTSFLYHDPVTVATTSVVRAAAYHQDFERSEIASEFYLINRNHALPVLAIITDSLNLWGPAGIYTNFNNSGLAWERFAQIRYLENGILSSGFNAGIRIQGASSVGMHKKSFRLFFRKEYGEGKLDYPLFDDQNFSSFDDLVLKSGYDDDLTTAAGTLLRDALSNDLWSRCGGLATQSTWAVVYLNTNFWGIYNIREYITDDFIAGHTNYDSCDLIRFNYEGPELRSGNINRWNTWYNFIRNNDLSLDTNYNQLLQWTDMDNFINMLAFAHCTSYYSWGWGVSLFAENGPSEKWRCTTWDADRAFDHPDTLMFDNSSWEWADIIPYKLLQNQKFAAKFINRTCDLLNTVFLPENSLKVLEKHYNSIRYDIGDELQRWNPSCNWENNVDFLRYFLQRRPAAIHERFPEKFPLGALRTVGLAITGEGTIRINTLYINEDHWLGKYFENNAIEIEAIPARGYKFESWNGNLTTPSLSVNLYSDTLLEAIFIPDYTVTNTVIITEISSLSSPRQNPGDWIELYNSGFNPVDISGWTMSDGDSAHCFNFPENTIIQSGGYIVVAEDQRLFRYRYPAFNKSIVGDFGAGTGGFALNTAGETIYIRDAEGVVVDSVSYLNQYPWPVIMNANYGSIQVKNTDVSNDDPYNWRFIREELITPGDTNAWNYVRGTDKISPHGYLNVFPNPAGQTVYIRISLIHAGTVDLSVFDLSGRKLATIQRGYLEPGTHEFSWTGTDLAGQRLKSGVYLIIANTGSGIIHQKLVVK